jgi:hypothetical protein
MATDAEIEALKNQWRDISFQPIPEEEKEAMRMWMAIEIGKLLITGGAQTKKQFLECFHGLLGSTSEQYARTAYTIGMTTAGAFETMELWDEDETEQQVLEAAPGKLKTEFVRKDLVPKGADSRPKTMFSSKIIWFAVLGFCVSRHKGAVKIEPEYGGPSWEQSESQFKIGNYIGASLILGLALFLLYTIAKGSKESK